MCYYITQINFVGDFMFKKSKLICKDVYGLELNIGDKVIPIVSEAISNKKMGIISDIKFDKKLSFLTLIDEMGNIIYKDILSSYYTTLERYNEKENENIILWINFHSDKGYVDSRIPLNSGTKSDFIIPADTVGISISYDRYEQDEAGCLGSFSNELYFFALKRKVSIYVDNDLDELIINTKSNGKKDWISKDAIVKLCSSFKQLREELSNTIEKLKNNDLDKCNRKIPYEDNKELQDTIKVLKKANSQG